MVFSKTGPFKSCNARINPLPYIRMCEHDVCHCLHKTNADASTCKCSVLSSYARACADAGFALVASEETPSWREAASCEMTCSNGRQWQACGRYECENTCQKISAGTGLVSETCNQNGACYEGCVCPQGSAYDAEAEKCVNVEQCSCYHQNKAYAAGTSRQSMCETCECENGAWRCRQIEGCTRANVCGVVRKVFLVK